ncbi:MAG: DUF882 domain-containing protein [Alphaproteobacteria bacterium]|nr:MAG: DUF882 domain-containing protein [Alphaproteobacteria bacterium]TAF76506.1 MAG: DUF882 domain-containing protein [Alphaproteobacteria bacterium]
MMFFEHYSLISTNAWHYRYFTPRELASKGDGSLLVNHDAIARLEHMREIMGVPLIITSAYRDPLHNAKIGGAPLSMHRFGRAFDVSIRGHDRQQLYQAALTAGFTGFGFYATFLHVDTGRKRHWGKSAPIYGVRG